MQKLYWSKHFRRFVLKVIIESDEEDDSGFSDFLNPSIHFYCNPANIQKMPLKVKELLRILYK